MKKKIYDSKVFDLLMLSLIFIISLLFVNYLESYFIKIPSFIAFYFVTPQVLYLSFKKKKNWYSIILTIVLVSFFGSFLFTFIAQSSYAWTIPESSFPKLFGFYAFEDIIYSSTMTTQVVVFYQHFIEDNINKPKIAISNRYYKIIIYLFLISCLCLTIYYFNPNFFKIRYSYIIYLFPLLLFINYHFLKKRIYFIKKFLYTNIFIFIFYFFCEYIAVGYEIWTFEGEYIGYVNIDDIKFPVEEVIVFFILFAPAVLSCYEGLVKKN